MSKHTDLEARVKLLETTVDHLVQKVYDLNNKVVRPLGTPQFTDTNTPRIDQEDWNL